MAVPKALAGWWKQQGRMFLVATVLTAAVLIVAGWLTGVREIARDALLTVVVAALLPFLIIAGILLLVLVLAIVLALPAIIVASAAGGDVPDVDVNVDASGAVEAGGWLVRPYYRFLGRRRHPVFWGIPAGATLGALVLWGVIALVVMPGESRTVRALSEAQHAIERVYKESGSLPRPDTQGHLAIDNHVHVDGFGRPFTYRVDGSWKLASWTLTSRGYDEDTAGDDLCLAGSTKLVRWAAQARELAHKLDDIASGTASLSDRLAGIAALRCGDHEQAPSTARR